MVFSASEGVVGVWLEIEERDGERSQAVNTDRAKSGDAIFFD